MKSRIIIGTCLMLAVGSAQAPENELTQIEQEMLRWIVQPCVMVQATLARRKDKWTQEEHQLMASQVVPIMLQSQVGWVRQLASAQQTWTYEQRRDMAPVALKLCIDRIDWGF